MKELKGLKKQLNKTLNDPANREQLKHKAKGLIQDKINEILVDAIKSSGLEQWVADKVSELATSAGFDLRLTKIGDKAQTRADVDAALVAKINALAGTNFETLLKVNKAAIATEVGKMIGTELGIGNLFPVAAFREAMGAQLVAAFDGGGSPLFAAPVVAAIEKNVLAGWSELSSRAVDVGNPMSAAGAPRDAAHAAKRAAGRVRMARFRRQHYLHWVENGSGRESTGNGREGLTGVDSGNVKQVRET